MKSGSVGDVDGWQKIGSDIQPQLFYSVILFYSKCISSVENACVCPQILVTIKGIVLKFWNHYETWHTSVSCQPKNENYRAILKTQILVMGEKRGLNDFLKLFHTQWRFRTKRQGSRI